MRTFRVDPFWGVGLRNGPQLRNQASVCQSENSAAKEIKFCVHFVHVWSSQVPSPHRILAPKLTK